MIEEYENSRVLSRLSQSILEQLAINEVPEIKGFVYGASKGEVAALVPLVVTAAKKGEEAAIHILREAGRHLGEMTLNLFPKLGFKSGTKIALKGSILVHIPWVQEAFMGTIESSVGKCEFITDDISSTKGAFYLAQMVLAE
jgi:N-acetylglucosamine kinase-like BadF-type ATPase